MYLIKEQIKILILILLGISMFYGCYPEMIKESSENQRLIGVFDETAALIEAGEYVKAHDIYLNLRENYNQSEYADDIAYRLAYLHVIAEEDNPLFDYKKALVKFTRFKSEFPHSRYIAACKNWIKVLNLVALNSEDHDGDVERLRRQISELIKENEQLKQSLIDLEEAIQR